MEFMEAHQERMLKQAPIALIINTKIISDLYKTTISLLKSSQTLTIMATMP